MRPPVLDSSSLSSFDSVDVSRATISAKIDWDAKVLRGSVSYGLKSRVQEVVLDSSYLEIESVKFDGADLEFSVGKRQSFLGSPILITGVPAEKEGQLEILFSTTSKCTGLQWLSPEQTIGKKAPFLFSQCEPIHARSIFPCFDTPSVKIPYRIEIDSKYTTLVSGIRIGNNTFEQKIPIPSYLFALASGDLVGKPIGPRSHVWAEPAFVDACQWEFEKDTEEQLKVAESLVFPYEWGTYDVLVLPPSFPFGGMENPNITFATPTLIAGDRTLVNVIAHELAHSWSGNLVSNASWAHFWLNEGWTVYIERRILGKIHGEAYRHFSAIEGWHDLQNAVDSLPVEHTKLRLEIDSSVDPDDTFSTVPYEKGSTFLWYLENLVGLQAWDAFIPKYFTKFKYKSLTTDDFKAALYEHLDNKLLDEVDWKLWLDSPGMPPKPDFNDELAKPCTALAEKWSNADSLRTGSWKKWASHNDILNWNPLQLIVFLNSLLNALPELDVSKEKLAEAVKNLGAIYQVDSSNNSEIKFRWLQLSVSCGVEAEVSNLAAWLGEVGRMKFVRPGYKTLKLVDKNLAVATFEKYKSFYHAICRAMVEKDLQK